MGRDIGNPQRLAHQVELSGEVGATLHIEPSDNPRAGKPAVTWFALVTEGGRPVPLAACDCELSVYALPRDAADLPLSQPPLSPLSAEGYQAIPSAEITFPAVGEYELLLTGSASGEPEFEPFELSFDVLVARGSQGTQPAAIAANNTETPETVSSEGAPERTSGVASEAVAKPIPNNTGSGQAVTPLFFGILIVGLVIVGLAYRVLGKKNNL